MNKKGIALIIAYMVTTVLTILTIAFLSSHISENIIIKKYGYSARAFWLAEAGLERGIWELKYGGMNWQGWSGSGNTKTLQTSLASSGDYDVTVTFPQYPSLRSADIVAIGYFPNRGARDMLTRRITIEAIQGALFSFAAFGQRDLELRGNSWADSYDSTIGRYDSVTNKEKNGDIGTNGTGIGAITLFGNATIEGDVSTGSGGTIEKSGTVTITGWETHDNDIELPPVTVSGDLTGLRSGGRLTVRGNQRLVLNPGDYKFSSISITDYGRLTITGEARIYLTGSTALTILDHASFVTPASGQLTIYTDGNTVISGNGIVNQSLIPSNLVVYGTGIRSSRTIQLLDTNFYGAIYAPEANILLAGDVRLYGSVLGRSITSFGNTWLHCDEALNSIVESLDYNFQSWQERQP